MAKLWLVFLLLIATPFLITSIPTARASTGIIWQSFWVGNSTEHASAVAVDPSGNSYITGFSYSFHCCSYRVFLVKFDSTGGLLWQRLWGGNAGDVGQGVAVDASGNVYVTGYSLSFILGGQANEALILLKFNSTGFLLWQRTWEGTGRDEGRGVAIDPSGNIFVTGFSTSQLSTNMTVILLKFNSSGALLWSKYWGSGSYQRGFGVAADAAGNAYVTGEEGGSNYESLLLKYNSTGDLQWQKTWGGPAYEGGYGVAADASGNAYVAGYTGSFGAGGYDAFILKFITNGTLAWQKTWGEAGDDEGHAIALNPMGGIFVTGWGSPHGTLVPVLLKIDATGNLLYEITWGGSISDFGYGVSADSSGNAHVTGTFDSAPPYSVESGNNNTLGTPSYTPTTPAGISRTGAFTGGTPAGILTSVSGSTTPTTGGHAFLFTYGQTNPTSTAPTPPQSLAATAGPTGIGLMWNPPSSNGGAPITGYKIYRGTTSNGEGASSYLTIGNLTSYTDTGVNPSTTYYYKVTALNSVGESSSSQEVSAATPSVTIPGAPTNLVTSAGTNSITLTWSAPASNGGAPITGYSIYRGTSANGEGSSPYKTIGNVTTYVDSSASSGTAYFYTVKATNSAGSSAPSNEDSATISTASQTQVWLVYTAIPAVIIVILLAVVFLRRRGHA